MVLALEEGAKGPSTSDGQRELWKGGREDIAGTAILILLLRQTDCDTDATSQA